MWLKMGCLDRSRGGRLWPTSFLLCGKMSAVRRALPKFRPTPRRRSQGLSELGAGGRLLPPQILPDQLTLFQPGVAYTHHITTRLIPPGFS